LEAIRTTNVPLPSTRWRALPTLCEVLHAENDAGVPAGPVQDVNSQVSADGSACAAAAPQVRASTHAIAAVSDIQRLIASTPFASVALSTLGPDSA
jgi:hypothetical protein